MKKTILIFFVIFILFGCSSQNPIVKKNNVLKEKIEIIKIPNHQAQYYGDGYIKIDNTIYRNGNKLSEIDASTFEKISNNIFEDKNGIYLWSYPGYSKIVDSDKKNKFHFYGSNWKGSYYALSDRVYYNSIFVEWADAESFGVKIMYYKHSEISENALLAYDKYGVYIDGQLRNYDIDSIELITHMVVKDRLGIWSKNQLFRQIDTETFQVIPEGNFQDKNNHYCGMLESQYFLSPSTSQVGEMLNICFPDFFLNEHKESQNIQDYVLLNEKYFLSKKTKNIYYIADRYFPEIFPIYKFDTTFDKIDFMVFSHDKEYILINGKLFANGKKLYDDANKQNLRYDASLKGFFYEDNFIISDIGKYKFDGTAELLDSWLYIDDKHLIDIWESKKTQIDKKSFNYLGERFSKDKNNVYYGTEILEEVDPETYEYIGDDYSFDTNNIYYYGNKFVENESE